MRFCRLQCCGVGFGRCNYSFAPAIWGISSTNSYAYCSKLFEGVCNPARYRQRPGLVTSGAPLASAMPRSTAQAIAVKRRLRRANGFAHDQRGKGYWRSNARTHGPYRFPSNGDRPILAFGAFSCGGAEKFVSALPGSQPPTA